VKEEQDLLLASENDSPELKVVNFSATLKIKVESEYIEVSADLAVNHASPCFPCK
jgi:hypothetical protein